MEDPTGQVLDDFINQRCSDSDHRSPYEGGMLLSNITRTPATFTHELSRAALIKNQKLRDPTGR